MASEQELKDAIAAIGQSQATEAENIGKVSTSLDAIIAKLASAGVVPDEDVASLKAVKDALDASNVALQAAADKAAAAAA